MQCPWHLSAYIGRYLLHGEMALRTPIFRRHCDLLWIPARKNRPCPQSPYNSPQRRRNTQAQEMLAPRQDNRQPRAVIRPRRLEIALHTTDAISGLKTPTNLTELRSFLGLCNVFRRFAPNFTFLAAPLNMKLKINQPATLGPLNEEEVKSMASLMIALIFPSLLALPNRTGHITLDTDACNVQVGCLLLQQQPNETTKPIGYWSRSLTETERKYDTTQHECLEIVWSILLLRLYFEKARFTICKDHGSLKRILNLTDSTCRLARWRIRISKFELNLVHRVGVKHPAADALCHLPTTGEDQTTLEDDLSVLAIDATDDNDQQFRSINPQGDDTIPFDATLDNRLIHRQVRTRSSSNKQMIPNVGKQRIISGIRTPSSIRTPAVYLNETRL